MKAPLWTLVLLLCLCVPRPCVCQRDCFSCGKLFPQHHTFNLLVCLVACEDKVSPVLTWDLCRQAAEQLQLPSRPLGCENLTGQEEAQALLPADLGDGGLLYSKALDRFRHVVQTLSADQPGRERQMAKLSSAFRSQQLGPAEEEGLEEQEGDEQKEEVEAEVGAEHEGAAMRFSKRFVGFLKGKHGYRKLMEPGRPLYKRYGGFIGIRKSARKWNNQKRFSEFLKQYLGISSHSSKYNSLSADFNRQNEV
ncbi:prepronociceptin-like [Conger conger]|uniref:prepronociceptin-like n=1 Tax=Conger conger TaxID=82655 RepID=UPI002A5AF6FC|nr:prepronociceptin-like [Conger conger]